MPLPTAADRTLHHERVISCNGYRRTDGLWDIEAQLIDTKTTQIDRLEGGIVAAGQPLHDMWLRLTIDEDLTVHAVAVAMDHTPYAHCKQIEHAFQTLVGERIGRGWYGIIRQRLGGIQGCTHLVELLTPVTTTAYQTLYEILHEKSGKIPIDGCHAWAADGSVVKRFYPQFYKHPERNGDPDAGG